MTEVLYFVAIMLAAILVIGFAPRIFSRQTDHEEYPGVRPTVTFSNAKSGSKLAEWQSGFLSLDKNALVLKSDIGKDIFNIPLNELKAEYWGVKFGFTFYIGKDEYNVRLKIPGLKTTPYWLDKEYKKWNEAVVDAGGPDIAATTPAWIRFFFSPFFSKFNTISIAIFLLIVSIAFLAATGR